MGQEPWGDYTQAPHAYRWLSPFHRKQSTGEEGFAHPRLFSGGPVATSSFPTESLEDDQPGRALATTSKEASLDPSCVQEQAASIEHPHPQAHTCIAQGLSVFLPVGPEPHRLLSEGFTAMSGCFTPSKRGASAGPAHATMQRILQPTPPPPG